MNRLDTIQSSLTDEMAAFEQRLGRMLASDQPALQHVVDYVLQMQGKRLRPMLVLLSARLFGPVAEQAYDAAVLIEVLHTASLVHDDVVDAADRRRGRKAVHVAWSPQVAVLLGDYLLARALQWAVHRREFALMEDTSAVVATMSEGEVFQLEKTATLDITEEEYYRVIADKTASLLSLCTRWGARSAGVSDDDVRHLSDYGRALGMAFQIRDDLFDIAPSLNKAGKPRGNDLRERKLTLPVIHALRSAPEAESAAMRRLLEQGEALTDEGVETLSAFAVRYGGVAYAEERMQAYAVEAAASLAPYAGRPGVRFLTDLLDFVIQRDC